MSFTRCHKDKTIFVLNINKYIKDVTWSSAAAMKESTKPEYNSTFVFLYDLYQYHWKDYTPYQVLFNISYYHDKFIYLCTIIARLMT